MLDNTPPGLLGARSPAAFLSRYWQKKPLLIRAARPDFSDSLSRDRLIALACRDDVDARLVLRERGHYSVTHGPFVSRDFRNLPATNWTLLV
jgi:50S ribosomal protein L16 3-hydroxylase